MPQDLIPHPPRPLQQLGLLTLPRLITDEGAGAATRFVEFFTANIRNPNTRDAYARATWSFCSWCEGRGVTLPQVSPFLVAGYIEELGSRLAKPSVKQHLAAVRMLFDWLVTGQVVPFNPATSVRGPKHVVRKGKTLVLEGQQAQELLEAIDTTTIVGLRDKALLSMMVYSFARIGAAVAMDVEDYCAGPGRTMLFRLHEKGGKEHEVPAHHQAEVAMDVYLAAVFPEVKDKDKKAALFQSIDRHGKLTGRRLDRRDAWAMIKRRAKGAGLPERCSAHTFRATGITVYMGNGGSLEHAQQIAGHSSPRTTKLYDRTDDTVTLDEINRIDLGKAPARRI
jgi:site-specific recombinase XerD